jgi:hypothetical protein
MKKRNDVFLDAARLVHETDECFRFGCCYAISCYSDPEDVEHFLRFFERLYREDALRNPRRSRTWWFEYEARLCPHAMRKHRVFALLLADIIYNEK